MPDDRRGLLSGVGAYAIWGAFPLYWPLLEPAGAVEILAHRICWSLVTMLALTVLLRRTPYLRALVRDRRTLGLLVIAAVVISLNWGGFIFGVNSGRVVEVSLGYFINPLVTVLLGVLVIGERLRRMQWAAIGLAGLAVVVLTVDYGHPPWVALMLACSFATYGLVKKKAHRGAVESLTLETILVAPIALGYLVWLGTTGSAHFGAEGVSHAVLLSTTGIVTAIPLLLFGAAATRISMTTIGLLQYLTPTMHFLIGVFVYGEAMTPVKWVGFAIVWVALAIFTTETVRHRRRQLRLVTEASAV